MSSDENLPFYLKKSRELRTCVPEDDYLHPEANAAVSDDSLTETQFFGFSLPADQIHGVMYCWHHPNLRLVSGGIWVWQGIKLEANASEMYDWRSFMSDRVLANDLRNFRLENGYGAQVLEPLRRHRVTYEDPTRGNSVSLEYEAIAPAALWADGRHFEQTMRVRGDLALAGRRYRVDGYNVRDRSWGKPRSEAHMLVPPVSWMTGVFDDELSFNVTACDHPDLGPDWKSIYPEFSGDDSLMGGWIRQSGEMRPFVSCRKITVRNPQSLLVEHINMTAIDSTGQSHVFKGEVIAASKCSAWQNTPTAVHLTRWIYNGVVGYGDTQESHTHDFVRSIRKAQAQ
jgi:hypothetical protein